MLDTPDRLKLVNSFRSFTDYRTRHPLTWFEVIKSTKPLILTSSQKPGTVRWPTVVYNCKNPHYNHWTLLCRPYCTKLMSFHKDSFVGSWKKRCYVWVYLFCVTFSVDSLVFLIFCDLLETTRRQLNSRNIPSLHLISSSVW